MPKSTAVVSPNYGLYYDRPSIDVPPQALVDGMNFRVLNKKLSNANLGRVKFADWTLNGTVLGIDNFFPRGIDEHLIFMTGTDIYLYDPLTKVPVYLTPIYDTGTVSVTGTALTGTGTAFEANVHVGDYIHVGDAAYATVDDTWVKVTAVTDDTHLTLASTPATTSGAYTIRKVFTAAAGGHWDFDVFVNDGDSGDDLWFATNGVDPVVTWNGDDAQVTPHPELGFVCETIAAYDNMMIYGVITEIADGTYYPTSIINSEPGFPLHAGDNVTDPLSISSQFQVHSGTDMLVNLIPLGDNLVIYAYNHIVLAQFVGGDTVFIFRQTVSDLGPVSSNAIADFGNTHEFIGPDTQYSFDGVTASFTNSQAMRNLLLILDPVRGAQAFGHFDESNGDLIWSIPLTTDPEAGTVGGPATTAYVEHYLEDIPNGVDTPFSKRSFKFTATGFYEKAEGTTWSTAAQTWASMNFAWNNQFNQLAAPLNIGGDENGQLWVFGADQQDDGVGMPSFVHFGRFSTGSGRERNLLRRIYPFATQSPGVNLDVNVYMADHAQGIAVNVGTVEFDQTLPEGGHFASIFHTGRYYEVEFAQPDGDLWEIAGYDVDITPGGKR